METTYITLIVVSGFFLMMAIGIPVAFCLITSTILFANLFWNPSALYIIPTAIYSQTTKEIYIAIPLFVFLANILERSGIIEDLYDTFYKWAGHIGGGLSVGAVGICTIIDAISGLGASGIVTVGPIALPEMFKRNYNKKLAMGSIVAGSALGPLIPPSIILIIIAGFTGLSVGKLFVASLIPGLLSAGLFILYIIVLCYFKPSFGPTVTTEKVSLHARLVSLRSTILPLFLIIAVMGSIYTGIATPTEGAGAGAFGAIICCLLKGNLNKKMLYEAGLSSMVTTGMVMWLLIGGCLFASLLYAIGAQDTMLAILRNVQSKFGTLTLIFIIMFIVFIMGMFLDGAAITVLCMPIFFPLMQELGVNPLWFVILFTINIVMGYITPPFGMNLFYMKGITPKSINMIEIYKSSVPFVGILVIVLIITLTLPQLATWLPGILIK